MTHKFSPPSAKQRARALGDTYRLKDDIRRAVTIGINECFQPIPIPSEDDWLSIHEESGQTAQEFEQTSRTIPYPRTIYIQPIGSFDHLRSPSLDAICNFSSYFFPGCQLEILPRMDIDEFPKRNTRINQYTQKSQYSTTTIISHLKKMKNNRRQENHDIQELFSIGVTMEDIYSEPNDNFVYGCASIQDGIGIYSFARLDPLFPNVPENQPCIKEEKILILKRAISIFIHEVMHLFGLQHCIYYLCLMNGAEHEEEMDKQPLYLCPICLRKVYSLFRKEKKNVIIKDMYTGILNLCRNFHFQEEAQWYENRLKLIFNDEIL